MRKIVFLLMIVLLAGCGTDSKVEKTSSMKEENKNEQTLMTTQAIYIGLIDSHSIEVLIDNKPLALQINDEQIKILEPLKTNVKITITYYYKEETSQNILERFEIQQ